MTGAYLRVKREGIWQNVEIEYLSDEERNELFKESDSEEVLRWLNFMCKQYEGLVLTLINEYEKEERNE
jgi:hypothetical protein